MLPFSIFALLVIAGLGLSSMMSITTMDETEADDPEPDGDVQDDLLISVASGDVLVGTDGQDSFILADATGDTENAMIDAGAGDDMVDLTMDRDGNMPADFANLNIDVIGGEGDDTINVTGDALSIDGGPGDDIITALETTGSIVNGGDGNDTLTGTQFSSDGLRLLGGAGDDIIDGRGIENGGISGGDGNDDITFAGTRDGGAGYVMSADGGAGDDTIRWVGGALETRLDPSFMTGGEGADTFELILNQGAEFGENDGDPMLSDDGTAQLNSIDISDFDNSEDIIIVDGTASSDAYTFSTARLETFTDRFEEPYTALILRYESDTEDNRDVVVGLGTGAVTLDDITFTGGQTPMAFTDMR